jgi:hypothetical protein
MKETLKLVPHWGLYLIPFAILVGAVAIDPGILLLNNVQETVAVLFLILVPVLIILNIRLELSEVGVVYGLFWKKVISINEVLFVKFHTVRYAGGWTPTVTIQGKGKRLIRIPSKSFRRQDLLALENYFISCGVRIENSPPSTWK